MAPPRQSESQELVAMEDELGSRLENVELLAAFMLGS